MITYNPIAPTTGTGKISTIIKPISVIKHFALVLINSDPEASEDPKPSAG